MIKIADAASRQFAVCLSALTLLIGSVGCAALKPVSGKNLPTSNASSSQDTYTVEFKDPLSLSKPFVGRLHGEPVTVQQALEDSGAWKRYRHIDVEILRTVPGQYKPLRLSIGMQKGRKAVKFEQDYAILPGDRIVVSAKYPNPFGFDSDDL